MMGPTQKRGELIAQLKATLILADDLNKCTSEHMP
jgi:hypothetical protein